MKPAVIYALLLMSLGAPSHSHGWLEEKPNVAIKIINKGAALCRFTFLREPGKPYTLHAEIISATKSGTPLHTLVAPLVNGVFMGNPEETRPIFRDCGVPRNIKLCFDLDRGHSCRGSINQ